VTLRIVYLRIKETTQSLLVMEKFVPEEVKLALALQIGAQQSIIVLLALVQAQNIMLVAMVNLAIQDYYILPFL